MNQGETKMLKRWVSCELSYSDYVSFRSYLKKHEIYFETSACGTGVHIEVFASYRQIVAANKFLDML